MTAGVKADVASAVEAFRKYNVRVTNNVEATVKEYALIVERAAKISFKGRNDESVYNEPPRVDTGRLRASITHRSARDGNGVYFAEIGTNVEYASDVEHGTSETMPHPFLGYALGMYEKEIERELGKAIKEAENA